ncbi:hypothetical protein BIFGAL_02922 [Bifidobacterium gallicum DSM 20093 = LMG 11596]|uniref:Uncharacterized protein n=1 Tax=Bifidobacterium gallicum DSM 20093 = LMG 11596 TaxID=561180 RepID=D1NT11_9BIFI|nr:hypothetical protein BIFGAL_02922 [Bifidobacterium gallicum DSM 20093 = LMG 11596]
MSTMTSVTHPLGATPELCHDFPHLRPAPESRHNAGIPVL